LLRKRMAGEGGRRLIAAFDVEDDNSFDAKG
jgi:hypothetical protein